MISATAPAFLAAGALLAGIPIVLHFLARRPPARASLPTARFLTEEARTLLRLRRSPTDLVPLVVRVLFALALGAAFAGLRWSPEREGVRRVILVDAGADSLVEWTTVADAVEEVALGAGPEDGDVTGPAGPPLVLAYGLDDGFSVVTPEAVRDLVRGSSPATLDEGLRALRAQAAASRFAEAEVTWVGRPSWRIWSPGIGLLRPALWPGRIELRALEGGTRGDPTGTSEGQTGTAAAAGGGAAGAASTVRPQLLARVAVSDGNGVLRRALTALGARVEEADARADVPPSDAAPDWILAEIGPGASLDSWLPDVRSGATLVAFGDLPSDPAELPWTPDPVGAGGDPGPARVLLPTDRVVGEAVGRGAGIPVPGARTLLVFDDGRPGAAARPVGDGCVAWVAAPLTAPALTTSPAYPELLRALLQGCRGPEPDEGPLDRGGVRALERPDLPVRVQVAAAVGTEGRLWTRWLLLAALTLLGLEVAATRRRTP